MGNQQTHNYDECFFSSKPAPDRHIDRLSLLAQLCGLEQNPPRAPRVLEIGCSTGDNLMSLAFAAPHATCVGIDNSAAQISTAKATATALGLQSIRFECLDVRELNVDFGTFDYIICHGVYSWVPQSIQDAILGAASQCLSEQGILFLSFNAQPGWNSRGAIGKWLRSCPQPDSAEDAVAIALERLQLLKEIQLDDYSPGGITTRDAINHLLEQSPGLFLHETLNPAASSELLLDFVTRAKEFGFSYLADSNINHLAFFSAQQFGVTASLPALDSLGPHVVLKEQMWDLLYPRALRKVLLCRSAAKMNSMMTDIQPNWYLAAALSTQQSGMGDKTTVFESARGGTLEVTEPLVKAALHELSIAWPLPISLRELGHRVSAILSPGSADESLSHLEALSDALFPLFVHGHVEITLTPPAFTLSLPERPHAHPLARFQCSSQAWVCNYRHEFVILNNIERSILRLLDGKRDRTELQAAMQQLYESRELILTASEDELKNLGGLGSALAQLLEEALESFANSALIER